MSLKQSIVIKNEFSNKHHGGHGSTPGKFLTDYVGRSDATEPDFPLAEQTNQGLDHFITNYVARKSATEQTIDNHQTPNDALESIDSRDGRTFGNDNLSENFNELNHNAQRIQDLYEQGHSVQKLVFSFKTDYAKEKGILPDDYYHTGRGSFQGNVDELRLRTAMTNGINEMNKVGHLTNPVWSAALQVDTNHLHVHAVIADDVPLKQSQRIKSLADGSQEEAGKVTDVQKDAFRHTFDRALMDQHELHHNHDLVSVNRLSLVTCARRAEYNDLPAQSQLQAITDVLPDDRQLWKANSKSPKMARANRLMNDYVDDLVQQPPYDKLYARLNQSVHQYANARTTDVDDNQQYVDTGLAETNTRMKNAIYKQIKQHQKTPYQQVTQLNNEQLKRQQSDDHITQVSRAIYNYRNATKHQNHAEQLIPKYQSNVQKLIDNGSSDKLKQFFKNEDQHNNQIVDKYRYLKPQDQSIRKRQVDKLLPNYHQLMATQARLNDTTVSPMNISQYSSKMAKFSQNCYQNGVIAGDQVHYEDDVYAQWQQTHQLMKPAKPTTNPVSDERFDTVKSVDLDDVQTDLAPNMYINVADKNVDKFTNETQKRLDLAQSLDVNDLADETTLAVEREMNLNKKKAKKWKQTKKIEPVSQSVEEEQIETEKQQQNDTLDTIKRADKSNDLSL